MSPENEPQPSIAPQVLSLNPQSPGNPLRIWLRWIDRLLAAAWMIAALAFVAVVGRELAYHASSIRWNSMWESAPLEVAMDAAQGRPIYGNWYEGPVHLAIYGPLYYKTLGVIGALIHADHAAMIQLGRWTGIVFLGLGLAGVAWFVKSQGGPWWAALVALGCAGLLTSTALRFVASARPDAMAAALAVLGLAATVNGRRWGIVLGAVLLSAAWLTKITAVAAPAAALFALVAFSGGRASRSPPGLSEEPGVRDADPPASARWRRPAFFFALMLLINGAAIAGLMLATHGWFHRHLQVASSAPMSPHYAWFMLTRKRQETPIPYLFIFPALAMLVAVLVRSWKKEDAARNAAKGLAAEKIFLTPFSGQGLCIASVFFVLSMAVALVTAMRQGSDRNYLIEPTLAAGMLMGAWASRMAVPGSPREWLVTRAAAAFALFSPMLLAIPDRLLDCDEQGRMTRDVMQPYQDEALVWARTLPQPLVSLDSWLPFRAGVADDLSDPIAYTSYCMAGGKDPIAERARRKYYACIVTLAPADNDYKLYGDLGTFWPAFREAILANYTLKDHHGSWWVYVPKDATGGK